MSKWSVIGKIRWRERRSTFWITFWSFPDAWRHPGWKLYKQGVQFPLKYIPLSLPPRSRKIRHLKQPFHDFILKNLQITTCYQCWGIYLIMGSFYLYKPSMEPSWNSTFSFATETFRDYRLLKNQTNALIFIKSCTRHLQAV